MTFDLQTWFTANPLPQAILLVKYEPDWVKGREDMIQARSWTD